MLAKTKFKEMLCDRFMIACEASLLPKNAFAKRVGLIPSQITNISNYRNPPSHDAIRAAIREFGFTANWFYEGDHVGFRDEALGRRVEALEARAPEESEA